MVPSTSDDDESLADEEERDEESYPSHSSTLTTGPACAKDASVSLTSSSQSLSSQPAQQPSVSTWSAETAEALDKDPLLVACGSGDLGAVESCVARITEEEGDEAAVLDVLDADGNSALHVAANAGAVDVYKALAGLFPALLEMENLNGRTPLDVAASRGCLALVLWTHERESKNVDLALSAREYLACSHCGLCVVGRKRFASRVCARDSSTHRWDGGCDEADMPRHISLVRAQDFADATRCLPKPGPRPHGWWCKLPSPSDQPSDQSLPFSPP